MPNWSGEAKHAARLEGIDPVLFDRQMRTESVNYDPNVIFGRRVSPAGAKGIAQFMDATAKGLGVDPLHPRQALRAAAKLMRGYIEKFGGWENALRAYNAGPGAVQKSRGYAETNNYVSRIIGGRTPQPLVKPGKVKAALGTGKAGNVAQAGAGAAQAPDLGSGTDITSVLAQALQQSRGVGAGASAPAPPAFAAHPVAAGAGSPAAGVAAKSQPDIGALAAQVLGSVDTSQAVQQQAGQQQPAAGGAGGGAGVQGRTLYIGDSLGAGTEPNLKKLLGGHVDANVVVGRSSADGIKALQKLYAQRGYKQIVLDLGTNDTTAEQLARSVKAARRIAPDARIYIPTLNGPFATERKNEVLQKVAAADPGITLVPWRSSSSGHLAPDGIHATAQGYDARARLIARTMGWRAPAAGAEGPAQFAAILDRMRTITRWHVPYQYGGGHGGKVDLKHPVPLDCSGAVSAAIGIDPRVSGQFESFGAAGRGKHVTIYAKSTHVIMAVKLRGQWHYWGTSGLRASGYTGAGWIPANRIPAGYLSGFVARHPTGM